MSVGKKKPAKETETSFEKCLAELESIVGQLEGGKLGLAESIEVYEVGVKHLKSCYDMLSEAERRIVLVSGLDATGRPRTAPLNTSVDESLTAKSTSRSRRRTAPAEVDDESSLF
jgi:exodeoxyribonuclease VII small subunit